MYELDGSPQLPRGNAGTASAAAAALGKRLGWSNGSRGPRMETSILRCSKPSSAFPLLSTLPKTRAFPCSPALGRAGTPGGTAPRTEVRANPPVNPTPPAEQGRSPPSPGQRCEATSPAPPRRRPEPPLPVPRTPLRVPSRCNHGESGAQTPPGPDSTAQPSPQLSPPRWGPCTVRYPWAALCPPTRLRGAPASPDRAEVARTPRTSCSSPHNFTGTAAAPPRPLGTAAPTWSGWGGGGFPLPPGCAGCSFIAVIAGDSAPLAWAALTASHCRCGPGQPSLGASRMTPTSPRSGAAAEEEEK